MKSPRKLIASFSALVAVLALGGLLDAAVAASSPPPPPGAEAHHHGGMHGGMHGDMRDHEAMMGGIGGSGMALMHAFHKLDLSDAQREKLRALMKSEHEKMMSSAKDAPATDLVALGNPVDPKHAAAVEAAKQRAVAFVQHAADLEQKAYELLTPEQMAKLPQVLADEQKQMQEHMQEHAKEHAAN